MRIVLPLIAVVVSTGAAPAPEAPHPIVPTEMLAGPPGPGEPVCRDVIHEAREDRGLPKLDEKEASADEPLFIAAVDKRIDGCSMLVMRNDTSDVRPLPPMPAAPPSLRRIPGG